jgi:hypothetical protein
MRTFTTDGPCDLTLHHVLPAAPRLAEARSLIDQGAYFVVRAPGRTGKTTTLRTFAAQITSERRYAALFCSAAVASAVRSDVTLVQDALLSALRIAAEQDLPRELQPPPWPPSAVATRLWEGLSAWAQVCPRPIVVFFDDIDSLHDAALESVLRQLETGFSRRPSFFPWSIGLVGQLDIRRNGSSDADTPERHLSTGPFERFWSTRLWSPFTMAEIRALYAAEFGPIENRFTPDSLAFVHEASAGHPFLVQAFGRELTESVRDAAQMTKSHVLAAYRRLVTRYATPIDDLAARLTEPRIRRVIEPLLLGTAEIANVADSDVQFARDIGLIAADDPVRFEGLIHRAIVPRLLSQNIRRAFIEDPAQFFDPDGRLSMERLLQTFVAFYTTYATDLLPAILYPKIAPELVFLGVLLHVLEGRGWVDIELGASRGRIDITLSIPIQRNHSETNTETNAEINADEQREVLVLVTRRKGDSRVKRRGLEWLDNTLQQTSSDSGTLVVFDKRDKRSPKKRVKRSETTTVLGKTVRLLRV